VRTPRFRARDQARGLLGIRKSGSGSQQHLQAAQKDEVTSQPSTGLLNQVVPSADLHARSRIAWENEHTSIDALQLRRIPIRMLVTPFIRSVATDVLPVWRSLVGAALLYKLLALTLLTPIFIGMWHIVLAIAGGGVLADADIAKFFLGPFGWICGIVLGAAWIVIEALEQASLLFVLGSRRQGNLVTAVSAIRFAMRSASRVFAVSIRLVGWTILATLPFFLTAGIAYFLLLSDYDINYYLNQRPTEFRIAIGFAAILIATMVAVLIWLFSGWFLSLPLVIFDREQASDALSSSRKLVANHRRRILLWLVVWGGFILVAHSIVTMTVGFLGQILIPSGVGSLLLLATRVGILVLLIAAGGLAVNVLASVALAGVLFHGFEQLDNEASPAISQSIRQECSKTKSRLNRITLPRLIAGTALLSRLAMLIGYHLLESIRPRDEVKIMAHRGASFVAPENTLAAFRQAIDDGADWIEIDVQETADGEVVVVHDSDFMKPAKNPLKIWNATMDDLADIDVGSWVDPKFSSERVPTLREVLQLCRGKIGVNIELKYYGHDVKLEQRVVEIVESEDMVDQVMVMSLKAEGIAKMKALRPEWRCGLLLSVYTGELKKLEADFLAINAKFASRSLVQRAHKLDKEVYVWTVNDAALMSKMLNRRVDGLLTDRPDLAKSVIKQRLELNSAERLLAELSIFFNQTDPTNRTPSSI
ncbi:MAG: glycerophosphodiester phosphodiesterase, partial [Planctomycetota bacterium]